MLDKKPHYTQRIEELPAECLQRKKALSSSIELFSQTRYSLKSQECIRRAHSDTVLYRSIMSFRGFSLVHEKALATDSVLCSDRLCPRFSDNELDLPIENYSSKQIMSSEIPRIYAFYYRRLFVEYTG